MAMVRGPALGFNAQADPTTAITVWAQGDQSVGETFEIEYSVNSDLSGSTTTASGKTLDTDADNGANFIDITALAAGTTYYYTPVVAGSRALSAPFPTFKTLPASPVGLKIAWGSCFSTQSLEPGGPSFYQYCVDNGISWLYHGGDFMYSEDDIAGSAWSKTDITAPPQSHYQTHYNAVYDNAGFAALARSIPIVVSRNDHDILADWPDMNYPSGTNPWNLATDDPLTHPCYANGHAAWLDYPGMYGLPPVQSGEGGANVYYGRWVWGDYEIIVPDTRTLRSRTKGLFLGLVQKRWLMNRILNTTAKYLLIFCGDPFANHDAFTGDGWQTTAAASPELVIGYLYERELFDSLCARSPAQVYWFGGDTHCASHTITQAGIHSFASSPFDDVVQRLPNAMKNVSSELFRSTTADNRMGIITLGANGPSVDILRGNTGGGSNTISTEYTWTG